MNAHLLEDISIRSFNDIVLFICKIFLQILHNI